MAAKQWIRLFQVPNLQAVPIKQKVERGDEVVEETGQRKLDWAVE